MDKAKPLLAEQEPSKPPDIEEYDYAAQSLLQVPIEKAGLKGSLQNALSGGTRRNIKAPTQKKQPGKLGILLSRAALAALCLLLSYAVLLYLQQQSHTLLWLRQLWEGNILLMLFIIAVVSCLLTVLLVFLRHLPRFFRIRPAVPVANPVSEQAMAKTTVQGEKTAAKEESVPGCNVGLFAKRYDIECHSWQFHCNLKFLLSKKLVYCLQGLTLCLASLFCVILAFSYIGELASAGFFVALFLSLGGMFMVFLHNQYVQGLEHLFQSMLQQIYQYSSPTNSYNQLNAVNMLYALAFIEARYFQKRVITEFQNILKLTRSSWYQTQYSNSPSILVEEVLRKLLSAIDFQQVLFASPGKHTVQTNRFLREYLYHQLFLKHFQNFRAFHDHANVSLLSQMARSQSVQQAMPHFVLENYYFVGINLSNLRVQEAHFQNCQLSYSNWTNSDLSDCSISSSSLDQAILYHSSWRRFLWTANTAREISMEHCFFLQGNLKHCNLQGLQSGGKIQHCLLQECNISHSMLYLDTWQNVKASNCDWNAALFSLEGEVYSLETEDLVAILGNRLQMNT